MSLTRLLFLLLLVILTGCQSVSPQSWLAWTTTARFAGAVPPPADSHPVDVHAVDVTTKQMPASRSAAEHDQIALANHQQPLDKTEAIPSPGPMPSGTNGAPFEMADEEWTLEHLEQIALSNNPALSEAWARVQAAEGRWLQAGLPPNTTVGYSGQQLGSKGLAEQEGVFIGQEFVRLRKLRLSRAVAAQEINVARQEAQVQQRRLLTDVRLGFYEMLVAQRRLDLTHELLGVNRGAVDIARSLFDAKEVGQPDVLRATVELQSSQLLLKAAQNQYEAAWSKLTAVLGMPSAAPQRIAGQLEAEVDVFTQEDAMAQILASSPELAAAMAEVGRARFAVDRARVEPLPNLDVQGVVQADNSTGSSNGILQVTFPIPWLNRNQGGISAAESEVVAAQRAVARTELSLQRRLAAVYQNYATARMRVEGYRGPDGILDNVKKSLDAIRANYQGGETSYIDLLTAQRSFAQMNLAYVESIGELWAAVVEIDGLLLKDSLDNPAP